MALLLPLVRQFRASGYDGWKSMGYIPLQVILAFWEKHILQYLKICYQFREKVNKYKRVGNISDHRNPIIFNFSLQIMMNSDWMNSTKTYFLNLQHFNSKINFSCSISSVKIRLVDSDFMSSSAAFNFFLSGHLNFITFLFVFNKFRYVISSDEQTYAANKQYARSMC